MIEPQNTTLPVAAEPTPVDAPRGEEGFGAMLAQTLGMIPQVDPNAVRGILGDAGQQDGEGGDLGDGAESGEADVPGRHVAIPVNMPVRAAGANALTRPEILDTKVVSPVFGGDERQVPGNPVPVALQPSTPGAGPDGDGIWHPVPTDVPAGPEKAATATGPNPAAPGDGQPVAPPTDPAQPVPVRSAEGVRPTPAPSTSPAAGSGLPRNPVRVVEPPQNQAGSTPADTAAAHDSVRLADAGVSVVEPRSVRVGSSPVQVDSGNAPGTTAVPLSGSEAAPSSPITHVAAPAAPTQHSALAERVLQAVELQANQPPPRTMVVDIPEIEGLRLVVSVRAGAEVHVVPTSASAAGEGVDPFLEEVQSVLEHRGFVMTGDGRRRGSNPNQDEHDEFESGPRPRFRRPQPTDNDLRI